MQMFMDVYVISGEGSIFMLKSIFGLRMHFLLPFSLADSFTP